MISRLTVSLTEEEQRALERIAQEDVGAPKNVIHWLLAQEIERRNALKSTQLQGGSDEPAN